MRRYLLSLVFSVAALAIGAGPALAQSDVELRLRSLEARIPDVDRMEELERKVNKQSDIGLAQDIQELNEEMRSLRGRIEELAYELERRKEQQKQLYLDLDKRLSQIEEQAPSGGPTARRAPAANEPDVPDRDEGFLVKRPEPTEPTPAEQEDYMRAFELLKTGQYEDSAAAFERFLADYPDSSYSDNAYYWLGEANYVSRNYNASLGAFQKLTRNFPRSSKVPDALVKIGYIYYEQDKHQEARRVLQGVMREFPDDNAAQLAQKRLERMNQEGV